MITLIDFYADWCPPCQMMGPVLEEVERELNGEIEFRKVNVDEERDLAQKFMVMGIPTFVIMKDGQELDRRSGAIPKEEFKKWIKGYLERE
ncbi:thioredoxin [candidate division CPR3 bacterium 4484_211]|uniref:Thioredoxin n=1 Tax=candidate division CPR3 bacterium 4484_211 TaxID=1968527 RepID=A0A1W9NYN5_UNCC3|nr:MAG: thioredoxin [candidate division CPR3 bacterium 4484_211]